MRKTVIKTLKSRVGLLGAALCATSLLAPTSAMSFEFNLPDINTKMNIGGYVKLDVVYNDRSAGDDSMANFELQASGIPLSGMEEGTDEIVFNARESRLWFKTATPSDYGTIKTHLEFDFDDTEGHGNQIVSNSRHARLRHAYGSIGGWLFGQTWSTFMNLASMPETYDFGGPIGINFARQPMIRYTHGFGDNMSLALALENGETFVHNATSGTVTGTIVADDELMPDAIADFTWKPSWGSLSAALMLRTLKVDAGTIDDSETAASVRLGGAWNITPNDLLQGQFTFGEGIGRYSSLATHKDGYINASGDLEALEMYGGTISYQHKWTSQWRSTAAFGFTKADDPAELAGSNATEKSTSFHINTFWNPVSFCRIGLEYIYAKREVYDGRDGDLNRVMFSTKFVF